VFEHRDRNAFVGAINEVFPGTRVRKMSCTRWRSIAERGGGGSTAHVNSDVNRSLCVTNCINNFASGLIDS